MKTSEVTKEDTIDSNRYREVALPIAALVEKLDMPEENIATFMCYLEVSTVHYAFAYFMLLSEGI